MPDSRRFSGFMLTIYALIGIPIVLVGIAVISLVLSDTWPLPLFSAMGLLVFVATSAVVAWRRNAYRPRLLIILLALLTANILVLPISYIAVWARGRAMLQSETANLERLGTALDAYADDWDNRLPPVDGWADALDPYHRGSGDASLRPVGHESSTPALESPRYRYNPPKPGQSLDEAVVIAVTDWSPEAGVELYLHGSGRLERRVVWSSWKYLLNGRYPF